MLERIVYNALGRHLDSNGVTYPRQFGFRRNHSMTDAIMTFLREVLKSFDSNLMLLSVFMDLRKAFDTVSHSLILEKLESVGV